MSAAVTTAERVRDLRRRMELLLAASGELSIGRQLVQLAAEASALPHSQDQAQLMDDLLDLINAAKSSEESTA